MKNDLMPSGKYQKSTSKSLAKASSEVLKQHVTELIAGTEPKSHREILQQLIRQFKKVDFESLAQEDISNKTHLPKEIVSEEIEKKKSKTSLKKNHYLIIAVEII